MAVTEIAQLYVGFPGQAVDRPLKLLRGFERICIEPGQTQTASFFIPNSDLCYWNETSADWQIEPGTHTVYAGGSSDTNTLKSVTIRM
ncbi:MAG: fibronectin type III-like domain-contianing protein [Pseudomonadota bacterium]